MSTSKASEMDAFLVGLSECPTFGNVMRSIPCHTHQRVSHEVATRDIAVGRNEGHGRGMSSDLYVGR